MLSVSVADFTAHPSRYLGAARDGDEVAVLDEDGQLVARLVSPPDREQEAERPASRTSTGDADLDRLISLGTVRPGRPDAPTIHERPPLELPAGLLGALLEDREDRF